MEANAGVPASERAAEGRWHSASRFVAAFPAVLLVWLCAIAGSACAPGEQATDDTGAGGTPSFAAESAAQNDTTAGSGEAGQIQRPASSEKSDSAAERTGIEMAVEVGSGIEGRVTVGPVCPVAEEGKSCPDRPYQAGLTIRRADSGDVVATIMSDAGGLFRVELPPGLYVVDPGVPRLVTDPRAEPVAVEVMADRFTQVKVKFDSGIR
jgi:hypothetical protein